MSSIRSYSLVSALALALGSVAAPGTALADPLVTIVLSEEPHIVEPCHSSTSNIGRVVKQNIVETLTEINPKDGTVTPRLATSWKQLDPHTWRFELRQGVKFHDGSVFNAEAAAYAVNRTLDKAMDCEVRTKFFGSVEVKTKVVSPYTLDISTDKAAPILPTMMGTMTVMSPKTPMGKPTRNPVGTGPYVFSNWDVGREIILTRFAGYWGTKPPAQKARYIWRSESTVRAAMVAAGEADIAPNIAVQDATDPSMDFSYPNSETSRLRIDTTLAPLDDRRVREAINLAIDRNAIRGSIFSKDVIPATQLVVPSINGHNPDLKVWPYDPAKAQMLLTEARNAGTPVDQEILLLGRINIYPNATEVLEAIQAMLQGVGLNVKLKMIEVAEWIDALTKPYAEDRPPTLQQSQHDNNNGDAVFTVYNKYHSQGAQSTVSDAKLDDVIVRAEAATGEERRDLFREAFRIINDDIVADVPMYHMVGYTRVAKRVKYVPSISTNSELHLATITFR